MLCPSGSISSGAELGLGLGLEDRLVTCTLTAATMPVRMSAASQSFLK